MIVYIQQYILDTISNNGEKSPTKKSRYEYHLSNLR
jgi:hypothetical protein